MFPPKLEETAVPGTILWNMGLRPERGWAGQMLG